MQEMNSLANLKVGANVHYVYVDINGNEAHHGAIIARVVDKSAGIVHLYVFADEPSGGNTVFHFVGASSVPYSSDLRANTWHWMHECP